MTRDAAAARRRRSGVAALAIVALFVGGFAATAYLVARLRDRMSAPRAAAPTLPPDGPITIALTGDTSLIAPTKGNAAFDEVASLVRRATLGFTNVERFNASDTPRDHDGDAAALRALGFDVVSVANNHTMDRGDAELGPWLRALDAAGVRHAGAGPDLAAARQPATIGSGKRSAAFIAVTASAAAETIATPTQGDIRGRAGVSPLRYAAEITVDAATFETIAGSIAALNAGPAPGADALTMFGTTIRKGDRTVVTFTVNGADREAVLESVRAARSASEIVIVSLHAHEPSNASDAPADFVREFARAAVDAGAQVVVGHGPHRIRGMEQHGAGVIFYSLGHFSYDTARGDLSQPDHFDGGSDLYRATLRTPGATVPAAAQMEDERWWEGLLVTATFAGERLERISIRPLDLGFEQSFNSRGRPDLGGEGRGEAILRRFAKLSGAGEAALLAGLNGSAMDLPISESR